MSTTLTANTDRTAEEHHQDLRRTRIVKRVSLSVLVLAIAGVVIGVLVLLAWMVDETHFERPSQEFDDFERQVGSLPGVDGVDKERWVEAPTFSSPTSWMSVSVEESGLPGLLEAACSADYPDPVTWSIRVRTPAATEVSFHADATDSNAAVSQARCPDFGFDGASLVDELDRVAPGLAVQPAIWDNGRFALVVVEGGFTQVLPLVEHANELLAAAGLDADNPVEISSENLGVVLEPGESQEYLALLTELTELHSVRSFWADPDGAQADGIEKVQIVAPDDEHAAIEESIRASGLHLADYPVRFIEQ
ncbi:hypothetical protein LG299_05620 [Microbacterium lacus]|uniref:hypothetical protein n=1 Tax=Microbacterium lacus TaxID=415217 RepID=UPI00384C6A27